MIYHFFLDLTTRPLERKSRLDVHSLQHIGSNAMSKGTNICVGEQLVGFTDKCVFYVLPRKMVSPWSRNGRNATADNLLYYVFLFLYPTN